LSELSGRRDPRNEPLLRLLVTLVLLALLPASLVEPLPCPSLEPVFAGHAEAVARASRARESCNNCIAAAASRSADPNLEDVVDAMGAQADTADGGGQEWKQVFRAFRSQHT
jgi:hypothetical protein